MGHGIAGIDHPVVAVADLDRARDRFARLGFVTTPRRRFATWGNANHAVMLRHTYT
ncbi:MAG: VOC family protein [Alphaproteobacteria bacterium]|nr:VOC family protein [Alphaproteobacteria bacterium]